MHTIYKNVIQFRGSGRKWVQLFAVNAKIQLSILNTRKLPFFIVPAHIARIKKSKSKIKLQILMQLFSFEK